MHQKSVVQQLNGNRESQEIVFFAAENSAGGKTKCRPERFAWSRRVFAHRRVQPLNRFAVRDGIEHGAPDITSRYPESIFDPGH
jgi:hypothetical protein